MSAHQNTFTFQQSCPGFVDSSGLGSRWQLAGTTHTGTTPNWSSLSQQTLKFASNFPGVYVFWLDFVCFRAYSAVVAHSSCVFRPINAWSSNLTAAIITNNTVGTHLHTFCSLFLHLIVGFVLFFSRKQPALWQRHATRLRNSSCA